MRVKSERTEFGKLVAKLLVDMDMSTAELSQKLDEPDKYVSQIIYGKRNPTLADCFGIAGVASKEGWALDGAQVLDLIEAAGRSQVRPYEIPVADNEEERLAYFYFVEVWKCLYQENRERILDMLKEAAVRAAEIADVAPKEEQ